MDLYEDILSICLKSGVDFYLTLPCSYNTKLIKKLGEMDGKTFDEKYPPLKHIPIVREEAGVSISAGAHIAGRKTAMVIQNQGLGNMVTLMLSLNTKIKGSYQIPNLYIISYRGQESEKIDAQKAVGLKTTQILDLCEIKYCIVKEESDLGECEKLISSYVTEGEPVAILIDPKEPYRIEAKELIQRNLRENTIPVKKIESKLTRYRSIELVMKKITEEYVVSNLGHPSRELHHISDREKNFYLTSCLGHSYSFSLGLALGMKEKENKIICFEGDGGLLMNAGSLSILVDQKPKNLIIVLLDNGVYGSTGNISTYASFDLNLSGIIQAFGFPESKIHVVSTEEEIEQKIDFALNNDGPFVIHIITNGKYENVPIIPYNLIQIKERFIKNVK